LRPKISLRKALDDKELLGSALGGASWKSWRAILLAAMGEELTPEELAIFTKHTGRTVAPTERADECWLVVGRRGGKSRAMATLAVYLAGLCDYSDVLVRGEKGLVLLIAPDIRQARVLLEYAQGTLESTPMLSQLIADRKADELTLTTGITIEVRSASFRRIRGATCCAVLADEIAFFKSEDSSNPDVEILNAARPALATTGGPLICISSPHARKGALWQTYRKHFGKDGDPAILVAQGTSREFNPDLPQSVVDRAIERDSAAARAEYLAEFRTDIESLLTQEAVGACVDAGVRERPFSRKHAYVAFVDPSGGSSDAMTMAIAHKESETTVLDAIREHRPPFSPEAVVAEYASLIRKYRCSQCFGDRYAGEWVVEAFNKQSVHYEASEHSRSELYLDILPLINSRAVALSDHERLMLQLVSLERTSVRFGGGRDRVDHPKGMHDDLANAAAGALVLAHQHSGYSPAQRFQDTLKIEAFYKKQARSIA
jgi:hypothetical protein